MTRRSTKRAHRRTIAERERLERLAAFRSASARRLQAARLYRIGAEVLGELSSEGRERWVRATTASSVRPWEALRMTDDEVRADAQRAHDGRRTAPAPDGSAWLDGGSLNAPAGAHYDGV